MHNRSTPRCLRRSSSQLRWGAVRYLFLAMSAPSRRRSRRLAPATTAAPSPDTPPPARLLDLPTDLLLRAISRLDGPLGIARVAAVSLLFRDSLALEAIRLWAQERGFELPALPEGEGCAVRWLCFAALLRESNPPARAAAGDRHSLFIDGEGRPSSCGTAQELLGHGEGVTRLNTPTRLPSALGGERVVSMSAGGYHNLALTSSGAVWSWGQGGLGALGHGDGQDQCQPTKVEALAGQRAIAVWAGDGHSLAITADGSVWSWGFGEDGQLGHGYAQSQLLPKKVEAFAGQRVVAVSAGMVHSLALTANGAVWSWGFGGLGQLGHCDQQIQLLPKKIEALAGQRVVALSAGGHHSLALTADGAVWSWGYGASGKLGHGDTQSQPLPKKVEALAGQRVVAVSAKARHVLALNADGAVWSWGYGDSGRLGHGDLQSQLLPKKVEALAGRRVVAVSAGMVHSLALTADGAVWSWGGGSFGKLGHGDEQNRLLPKKVEAFAGQRIVAVSAGAFHSLALTADGAVWSWGLGGDGRLGHGDRQQQQLPKKVEAFAGQRVRCFGWKQPQPRPHRRRCPLYLGQGRGRLPRPRRGPVEPAAAQEGGLEGRGAGAGRRMRCMYACACV